MEIAIAGEHTLLGAKLELVHVKLVEIWPTRTAESTETTIIRVFMIEMLKRRRVIKDLSGQYTYEISSHKKNFIPILEWHTSMSKQGQANLNYVTIFTLDRPILLLSIRT
jgi:hypothetical protein